MNTEKMPNQKTENFDLEAEIQPEAESSQYDQTHLGDGDNVNGNKTVINNNYNSAKQKKTERRLEFTISGSIEELDSAKLYTIVSLLQQITGDATIKTDYTEKGSIKFILNGSDQGLQRLQELFDSGELEELLNSIKPEKIPPIVVENVQFREDLKTIDKSKLIEYIRNNKIHQKQLSNANLRGAYLLGANLREANLRGADLRGANLRGA
ncbi:MAG TPA: hypothetical protein DCF68_11545, partial [Cyanothece sp. UBA12306]|nr:hypothetical protein [Cyanothece sp. UBA12306]